mmetsp:Transcript_76293/g.218628  ORF Transcript_76293/g.218628 Transcript_76293/m.218628 type:complete len:258 (+) Transcript_76293:602-1375(+)
MASGWELVVKALALLLALRWPHPPSSLRLLRKLAQTQRQCSLQVPRDSAQAQWQWDSPQTRADSTRPFWLASSSSATTQSPPGSRGTPPSSRPKGRPSARPPRSQGRPLVRARSTKTFSRTPSPAAKRRSQPRSRRAPRSSSRCTLGRSGHSTRPASRQTRQAANSRSLPCNRRVPRSLCNRCCNAGSTRIACRLTTPSARQWYWPCNRTAAAGSWACAGSARSYAAAPRPRAGSTPWPRRLRPEVVCKRHRPRPRS